MHSFDKLLLENRLWAQEMTGKDPEFFERLNKEQRPEFLWIGCSDSRVPTETIVNAEPGEIFVHRNIANQIIMTDFNCLSVIQYAIAVLKVKHVIVCGHYNCGGVKASLEPQRSSLVIANKWLMHIKDVYRLHYEELESLPQEQRADRLVELNIIEQVHKLAHTSIVQEAWKQEQRPELHGWVYGLKNGLIEELTTVGPQSLIHEIYRYID